MCWSGRVTLFPPIKVGPGTCAGNFETGGDCLQFSAVFRRFFTVSAISLQRCAFLPPSPPLFPAPLWLQTTTSPQRPTNGGSLLRGPRSAPRRPRRPAASQTCCHEPRLPPPLHAQHSLRGAANLPIVPLPGSAAALCSISLVPSPLALTRTDHKPQLQRRHCMATSPAANPRMYLCLCCHFAGGEPYGTSQLPPLHFWC